MKGYNLLLLFLLVSFFTCLPPAFSQHATVKGAVYDSGSKPVAFATVALLSSLDSTVAGGSITDTSGAFLLQRVQPGNYVIRVHFLGYAQFKSSPFRIEAGQELTLPPVTLQPQGTLLSEIEVTARKPLIEMEGGKLLYHVQENQTLNGPSAREVLASAPGVTSDRTGYQLNGRPGAKVLINGRDRSVTLESVLSSLRAEDILRVELLSNPSSHYDAQGSGGVINIVTKRNANEGLSGTYGLSASMGREQFRYSSNLGLNYKKGSVALFSDVRINRFANHTTTRSAQVFLQDKTGQQQQGESSLTSTVPSASLGGEFNLSARSKLGFELWGANGSSENLSKSRREETGEADTRLINFQNSTVQTNYKTLWSNLYYKLQLDTTGQQLRADVNFQRSDNLVSGSFRNIFPDADGTPQISPFTLFSYIPALSDLLTLQLDYELPLQADARLDLGAKYSHNITRNDVRYEREEEGLREKVNGLSSHYRYKEAVLALYGSYRLKVKAWTVEMGLRAENTKYRLDFISDAEHVGSGYWSLFPNISASRQIGEAHQFSYAASRRIQRQPYEFMNPFVQYIDEITFVQGNPDIKPTFSYNFDVQHSYNYQFFSSLGYSYLDDVAIASYELLPGTKTTRLSIDNLAGMHQVSFSFSAPYEIRSWWRTNNSVSGSLSKVQSGSGLEAYNEKVNLNYSLRNMHSFQLRNKWRASFSLNYYGPSLAGMYYNHGWFTANTGLSRKILKEKGSISFSAQDLFRTTRYKMRYRYNASETTTISYSDTQRFGISFSYNFGNTKVKRADHSRTNYEEQSRMNSRTN